MSIAVATRAPAPAATTTSSPAAPPPARVQLWALVRRGLRDNRRAPLVWGGALGLMSALVAALYPSIRGSLATVVDNYPSAVKQAFGITDLATVEAFLSAEMFSLMLPLAVAYFAMRRIASAIVGSEEHGDLDSILAVPVARGTLVAGAFATTALLVAAVLLVTGAMTAAGAALAGEPLALGRLVGALAAVWGLALFFAGCATLAAGMLRREAIVLGTGAGLLVGMYLLDVLGRLAGALEPLRWMSAFRGYGAPLVDGVDLTGVALLVVAGGLLATAGGACFARRDVSG